jgi:diguanylate cyclase (GGDEF)-like protein
MSTGSYLDRIESLAVRPRGRGGAAVAGLLLIGALVALLAAAWAAALTVGGSELDRADARLASEVRAVVASFTARVAAADSRAGSLAAMPALQRAILRRDRVVIRRVVGSKGDVAVYAGPTVLVGSMPSPAVTRSVAVVARGRSIGRVVGIVPVDRDLIDRLGAAAGVRPPDRLRVASGARAAAVPVGAPFERVTDRRYRVFAERLAGGPRPLVLEATTPRAAITDRAQRRTLWLILATLASVATLALGAWGIGRIVRGERRVTPRRRDVRQVLALVGDALASTHNPDKLLPVILHAAMEATGAVGGIAIRDGEEAAREGTFSETGRGLRVELTSGGESEEELALILYPGSTGFDERTTALAHSLAAQAAIALDNARLHGIVKRQAVTDELTGLANRRSFRETLEAELVRAERFDNPVALVVADLDDFKDVNDRFGHQAGDEVLRAFADVLRGRIRGVDLAARLGGEEFAVLLPETDAAGAAALAENLRAAVARLAVPIGTSDVRVTASFGVAAFPQTHSADELMTSADLALYSAKRQGKDRVIVVSPESR